MCGIFGVVNCTRVAGKLVNGLEKLEYRGYDSAGIAVLDNGRLSLRRVAGKVGALRATLNDSEVDGPVGIAHTRWATHGPAVERNAHPHATDQVAVVHNGIIENFAALRRELQDEGRAFRSDTDSEVIPQLISRNLDVGMQPLEAVRAAVARLRGAYALGIVFAGDVLPGRLVAARRGSPLLVGVGAQEVQLASDQLAFDATVQQVIALEDGDVALLHNGGVEVYDAEGSPALRHAEQYAHETTAADRGDFDHYMLKEMHEQPLRAGLRVSELIAAAPSAPERHIDFQSATRLHIVACGSSHYAGQVARHWFEEFAGLPVQVEIASEARDQPIVAGSGELFLYISQSGETADTLAALRAVQRSGRRCIALVNTPRSTMAREADFSIPINAGPEIGVAATKSFTCQLVALYGLAVAAAQARQPVDSSLPASMLSALPYLPQALEATLALSPRIAALAPSLAASRGVLFLGRGALHAVACEAALKFKELTYLFAAGYAAGELKHGPIALVDETVTVVGLMPGGERRHKMVSNLEEVAARGAKVIALADDAGEDVPRGAANAAWIPLPVVEPALAPFVHAVAVQLLAYHTALVLGRDVDQPRNLAKSVTVE